MCPFHGWWHRGAERVEKVTDRVRGTPGVQIRVCLAPELVWSPFLSSLLLGLSMRRAHPGGWEPGCSSGSRL